MTPARCRSTLIGVLAGVLAGVLLLAAGRATAGPAGAANSIGRAIRIYSPYAGGPAVAGNHLLVQVSIAEYRLDGLGINGPIQPDTGYWTLYVDGADAGLAVSDMIMAPNAALPRLTAGAHRIRVELVDSRGGALNPAVYDEEMVTLANDMVFDPGSAGAPAATIILPADGASVAPNRLFVKVRLNNFRPDARRNGEPAQPGSGTWWVTVDGVFAGLSMSEIIDLPNDALPVIAPGPHTLAVSLRGTDGRPVPGAQGSSIRVTVLDACPGCPPPAVAPSPTVTPGGSAPPAGCGAAGGHLFAATGHTVCNPFFAWWTRYGGLPAFGYPITEGRPARDASSGVTYQVQYFERARFEYHPEHAGSPYAVLLGRLGARVHPPDPAVPAPGAPGSSYFPLTGHTLSGPFLRYWHAHGGLFVHGYPISEPLAETSPTDGRVYTVQYFERTRFEWHPAYAGTAPEVLLGLLGVQVARQDGLLP